MQTVISRFRLHVAPHTGANGENSRQQSWAHEFPAAFVARLWSFQSHVDVASWNHPPSWGELQRHYSTTSCNLFLSHTPCAVLPFQFSHASICLRWVCPRFYAQRSITRRFLSIQVFFLSCCYPTVDNFSTKFSFPYHSSPAYSRFDTVTLVKIL